MTTPAVATAVVWRWHEEPEHGDYDEHGIPTLGGLDAESGDPHARCHLWPCENRLGWSLHEDDEHPHRSGMTWTMYLEVTEPGDERPAYFCEDCGGWLERTSGRTVTVAEQDEVIASRRRADAARDWPPPATVADAEAFRKWLVHGDYSQVGDPHHALIDAWEKARVKP